MKASEWIPTIRDLRRIPEREDAIWKAVDLGYWVEFEEHKVGNITVFGDYLSIGESDDFVRVPVSGPLALRIAESFNARLPTKDEVDAIWKAADVKLAPHPMGPPYDETMLSVDYFVRHNAIVEAQRAGRTGLIAGHKKDILGVTADGKHVIIYGWHQLNGVPIQGPVPNDHSHEALYADGSHGLRLVWD